MIIKPAPAVTVTVPSLWHRDCQNPGRAADLVESLTRAARAARVTVGPQPVRVQDGPAAAALSDRRLVTSHVDRRLTRLSHGLPCTPSHAGHRDSLTRSVAYKYRDD
jgi:hypothetical protein